MSDAAIDPYLTPNTSLATRVRRAAWALAYALLFRPSLRPMHGWRTLVLRAFGARIGPGCHIYPKARIWAPWNLHCDDVVAIADDAEIYNPSIVELRSHAIISQGAYLCGASHDFRNAAFPMISQPIIVGRYAWICARSTVQMGTTVGDGAVLALGAVATKDLAPWTVYGGVPAQPISKRQTPNEEQTPHRPE
jgi:putative colanic acid biosynthesis acetyltransferase WcaF